MDNSLLILENFMIVGKRGKSTPILFPKPTFSSPCRPERGHKGFFWGGKDVRHPQVTLTTMRLIRTKGVFRTVGSKSLSPSALARLQERTRVPPQTTLALFMSAEKRKKTPASPTNDFSSLHPSRKAPTQKTTPLADSHHQSFVAAVANPRPTGITFL